MLRGSPHAERRFDALLQLGAAFFAGAISGWVAARNGLVAVLGGWAMLIFIGIAIVYQTRREGR